jgi:carboxylate-amine ligase
VGARLAEADADRAGRVEPELHACQVELISDPCATTDEAVAQLRELRQAVVGTGAGLLGSGTHPSADEGEADITDKARYARIHDLLGDAVATPVAGLHVHVGMPDAETAIRVFNGLRRHLPLLQALAANSPFRHGRNTGLASAREVTLRSWPRSGVPRAMHDYDDFCAAAARLARAADVPDYTWFWWKLRPHPRLGTVEIRALDVQSTHDDTAALVALIHCLCRAAADAKEDPGPPPELVEEGLFRAGRYGVLAELPDEEGRLRPAHELLLEALDIARPYVGELGAAESLKRLPELIRESGGAGRQRAYFAIGGMDSLLRELTRVSSQ